jgi:simple sugar transport system permease protein
MSETTPAQNPAQNPAPAPTPAKAPAKQPPSRALLALKEIMSGSWLVSVLAVVLALVVGAILIAAADPNVQKAAGYLFARPADFFEAVWSVISAAYSALFQGAIFNFSAWTVTGAIEPLTDTLTASVPLIFAGLGLAIGFRAGMFNIGGQGQIILGAVLCGWVGFALHLPVVLHLIACVIGAIIGGAAWGFIPGFLKAKTGANEVITTIMLNWIAFYGVSFLLNQSFFQRPGANNPQSPLIDANAQYPLIFGPNFTTHLGFVLALGAVWFTWWLLERSTLGFKFRALGENPEAAKTAGINISSTYIWVMVIAGAMSGLAASAQVMGTEKSITAGIAGSIGVDAITVALLGRSRPIGTLLAGLLFGALKAGGYVMQVTTGTSIDVILVLQSVIVLLIAAPPLVRAVFRTPDPEKVHQEVIQATKAAQEVAS